MEEKKRLELLLRKINNYPDRPLRFYTRSIGMDTNNGWDYMKEQERKGYLTTKKVGRMRIPTLTEKAKDMIMNNIRGGDD